MEKPRISVRKPPSVDEFVNGPSAASGRGVVTRAEGIQLRRFTVYLKREQGDLLERRCFEQRRQLSDAIAEAVADWLAK